MLWFISLLILLWALAYYRIALAWSSLLLATHTGLYTLANGFTTANILIWSGLLIVFMILNCASLRRHLISRPIYQLMRDKLPALSQTEREALQAGTVWWDGELFSGKPDWSVLANLPKCELTEEERAFLQGPVETLCQKLDDWDITHNRHDLPDEIWDFIKQYKFCGLIIPKQYGGLQFSHYAHSEIVMKIASRSTSAAVTIMVPNSLGPAKLLLEYGTEQQKQHYLPRLATGQEIPCFALTGPKAGSDASAMPDTGIVCRRQFDGQKNVLGILLNWEKRYITLGPVATVLGLAFKLYDPEHIIGDIEDIGITVALIPTDTAGVSIGRRHFPLDSAFQNGPNWGKDVFIPMDWVIGGQQQVGKGWKMLMQCLSTGRGISLPALSTGAAKFTSRVCGAYARIRRQFNRPICEFEGIEDVLARIAGETYIVDATRKLTLAALDSGHKPAVVSAIIKYESTESMRRIVNDGMDILGGAGICLGPHNYLGRMYQVIPVGITVEGANILTRTMMIFGQGAVRCHPYIQKEMESLHNPDLRQGVHQFDPLLMQHIGFSLRNLAASFRFALNPTRCNHTPGNRQTKKYYRQIERLCANFALLTDFALLTLGGSLKRKERLSGNFADALSHLYLCSAVLQHYHDQGCQDSDQPLMHWACQTTLDRVQQALFAIFRQLPLQPLPRLLQLVMFPFGKPGQPPDEQQIQQSAAILLDDTPARDRLSQGIFVNHDPQDPTGRLEIALRAVLAAAPVEAKIRAGQKSGVLPKGDPYNQIGLAVDKKVITQAEARLMNDAEKARASTIAVDDFAKTQL